VTEQQRATVTAARIAFAGMIIAGGALTLAGQAGAEPEPPYPPPPPPPIGAPPVPEIPNPAYGQGETGAAIGYFGDLFGSFRSDNPLGDLTAAPQQGSGAPPGAGPSPPLPPGTVSLTAPESSTAPPEGVWLGPLPGLAPVPLAPPHPASQPEVITPTP
jgi:hypothetical protein